VKVLLRHQSNATEAEADPKRLQLPVKAVPNAFRRRAGAEDLNLNGSVRLRLPVQVNMSSAAEVHRLQFIDRSRRRRVVGRRVRRAAQKREDRVPIVSRRRNEVARLLQPSAARDNRKVEEENQRKKPQRPDPNNPSVIAMAAPERKFWSRFLVAL